MTLPETDSAALEMAAEVVAAENDDYTVLEKLSETMVHPENFNEDLVLQDALDDVDVLASLTETENHEYAPDASEVNSANDEVSQDSGVVEVNSDNDEAAEATVVEENSGNDEAAEATVVEGSSDNEEASTNDGNDEHAHETENNDNEQGEEPEENVVETTTVSVVTTTELPTCSTPGLQAHETDCRLYYSCSALDSADGTLRLQTLSCGEDEAFNAAWGRCARDISSCPNEFACLAPGAFEDPLSNVSYYLCYSRLTLDGYLLYHVKCGSGEVFLPEIGKCFIDLSDFANAYLNYDWLQVHDVDVVKLEYEQYKTEAKLQMKLEKEKAKMEKKLQKELEKLAKKKAKEEAKAAKAALLGL